MVRLSARKEQKAAYFLFPYVAFFPTQKLNYLPFLSAFTLGKSAVCAVSISKRELIEKNKKKTQ